MARGYKTCLGFAKETTYGTAASRTNWCHAYSVGLQERAIYEPVGVLEELGQPDVARDHIVRKEVSGAIEIPLQYEGIGYWLACLMGDEPTTTDTGGSAPYIHTYNRSNQFAESLTVEVVKGNSGRSEVFSGVKVTRGRIRIQPSSLIRLSLDLLGHKAASRGSAGSPTFSSDVAALACYSREVDNITSGGLAAEFSFNSANYAFQSFEIDINNNLSPTGDVESDYYASGIDQGGQGEIIVRAQLIYQGSATDALRTAHDAATESDVVLTLTKPGGNLASTITLRNCRVTQYEDPLSNPGRVTATVELRAKPDATDGALTLVFENDDSTYSTN